MTVTTITREQVNAIADLFEKNGVFYSTSYDWQERRSVPITVKGQPVMEHGRPMLRPPYRYERFPDIMEAVAGLPEGWQRDVDDIQSERYDAKQAQLKEARLAKLRAACEAVEYPAIRAYLLADIERRGQRMPEAADLSHLKRLAMSERPHKPAYKPLGDCGAKLRLKEAVCIGHRQEAYADNVDYAIPVTVSEDFDIEVCKKNLWQFASACRTSNGLAGYGSTWSFELVVLPEGVFVLADQRSSIAD